MDRQVTLPQRVTSFTWGSPPPCKQGLRFDEISPRSRKISQSSCRDLFYLAQMSFISARSRRDLTEITKLTEFLARSRLSRRNLFHIGEISFVSQKYLLSRASLGEISSVSCPRSLSSRADLRYITNHAGFLTSQISFISPRPQRNYKSRRGIGEISARSRLSRRDLREITNLAEFSSRFRSSRRDHFHLGEISSQSQRHQGV